MDKETLGTALVVCMMVVVALGVGSFVHSYVQDESYAEYADRTIEAHNEHAGGASSASSQF